MANEIVRSAYFDHLLEKYGPSVARGAERGGELFVRTQFHVVRTSVGVGGLSAVELEDERNRLNELFAPAQMRFCVVGPTRFIDSDLFYTQTNSSARIDALRAINPEPSAMNVYYVPVLAIEPFGEILGAASLSFSEVQGIVMSNRTATESPWVGVLAHEVGHYFDLYHTFETVFGAECPNGSNCAFAGDLVCDTPADPGVFQYSNCAWTGSAPPRCGSSAFDPPATNIMNYTAACMRDFTPDQIDRMRQTLQMLRPEHLAAACAGLACSPADVTTDGTSNGEPDGAVTLSDFSFYLSLWSAQSPGADITLTGACLPNIGGGDGVNLSDFSCYLSEWSGGCP
ncbi:MAG: GC-type dockerin domain-anchored protein [Planctomycetota bacterium]